MRVRTKLPIPAKAEKLPLEMSKPLPDEEVGYCRVSTDDQNPDMQIAEMRKRGITEDNIFVDHGVSGRTMRRPQLTLALKLMEGRPGWTLVVWKLDRLGRNALGMMQLAQEFMEKGWNLVSITESLDTRTAFGRFYFLMLAGLAQLESDHTVERTKAGMARRKELGIPLGRKTKITPEQFAEMEKMLLSREHTIKAVAKRFKVSTATVNAHFPGWQTKTAAERKAWRRAHPLPQKR